MKDASKNIGRGNFEMLPFAAMIDDPNNSRLHTDAEIAEMGEVIKAIGWTIPILIDEENNILAGHRRKKAGILIGEEEGPVIRKKGLTEAQKRHIKIFDNYSANQGDWDYENLDTELAWLQEEAPDYLESIGFDSAPFDALFEVEPEKKPAKKKPGESVFNNAAVKEVKLFYSVEKHEEFTQVVDEMLLKSEFENYSDLLFHMVNNYRV